MGLGCGNQLKATTKLPGTPFHATVRNRWEDETNTNAPSMSKGEAGLWINGWESNHTVNTRLSADDFIPIIELQTR
jgi:hypothetical protein